MYSQRTDFGVFGMLFFNGFNELLRDYQRRIFHDFISGFRGRNCDYICFQIKFAETLIFMGLTNQNTVYLCRIHKVHMYSQRTDFGVFEDGHSAIAEIMEVNPQADIVIVSSVGTQAQLRQAIQLGAKDFIQKPLNVRL